MSVITSEETADAASRIAAAPGTRTRPRRPGWGSGRAARPHARPPRPVAGPELALGAPAQAHGCEVPRPVAARLVEATSWRLTERGVALIMAVGLAIATAALAVVGLTAMRVTGDGYAPSGQVQVQR